MSEVVKEAGAVDESVESTISNVINTDTCIVYLAFLTKYKCYLKKHKNLVLDDAEVCRSSEKFSSTFMNIDTPYTFFKYFFTDKLIIKITFPNKVVR